MFGEAGDATRGREGSDGIYVSCSACAFDRTVECVDDALDLQGDHVDATSVDHIIEFDRKRSDAAGRRGKTRPTDG